MPITEELIQQLWFDLQQVIENPDEITRLKATTNDPTTAARIKRDEIEQELAAKYNSSEFLMNVRGISMGYGILTTDEKGNLGSVRSGGAQDGGTIDIGMVRPMPIPETNVLAYLKGQGIDAVDFPLIAQYARLHRLRWGTLKELMDESNSDLSTIGRYTLPDLIQRGPESLDPTPHYEEDGRKLTYEIMNHRKQKKESCKEDPDIYMSEFSKQEIERLQYFVETARNIGYVDPTNLSDDDVRALIHFADVGLFEWTNNGYRANWTDMSTSTVSVYNKLTLFPRDVNSLADIPRLRSY